MVSTFLVASGVSASIDDHAKDRGIRRCSFHHKPLYTFKIIRNIDEFSI